MDGCSLVLMMLPTYLGCLALWDFINPPLNQLQPAVNSLFAFKAISLPVFSSCIFIYLLFVLAAPGI